MLVLFFSVGLTRFREGDTVRVITPKSCPVSRQFAGKKGFIDEVLAISKTWGQRYYVNFLDTDGSLVDGQKLPELCLVADTSYDLIEAKRMYDLIVDSIVEEADTRSHKWNQVIDQLAEKHKLTKKDLLKIYTNLRNFESYYERWIKK